MILIIFYQFSCFIYFLETFLTFKITFRLRNRQVSLTFSKAKRRMKVISIEVTTLTQAVGQARNLKSKTIEIGCSNKNDVPYTGKKTKKSY